MPFYMNDEERYEKPIVPETTVKVSLSQEKPVTKTEGDLPASRPAIYKSERTG